MKLLLASACALLITASAVAAQKQSPPTSPGAQADIIGVIDSRTNSKMSVLIVACNGKTYGFEFPKAMLKDQAAMDTFLESVVIPKLEKVCK